MQSQMTVGASLKHWTVGKRFNLPSRQNLRSTTRVVPFDGGNVNNAFIDTNHYIAVLNVHLNLHRTVSQFTKFISVFLGKIQHLKVIKSGRTILDFVPPNFRRGATVCVDDYLIRFTTRLANDLLTG